MKLFNKILAGLVMVSAGACAVAGPISDTTSLNLAVSDTVPKSFILNITDGAVPYIVGSGPITNATLRINVSDPLLNNEKYFVYLGTNPIAAYSGININNTEFFDIVLDATALSDLSADGLLNVVFNAQLQGNNDRIANYNVDGATLTGNSGAAASSNGNVPEPATLGLFGITLAGLGAIRRRKQK